MVKMFESSKIGLFLAFSILSTFWFVRDSTTQETTEYEVVLEKYETCGEGHKTNIAFKNIKLDHGAKRKVFLSYGIKVNRQIAAPVAVELDMQIKQGEDWTHYMNPKVENFCDSLNDKEDLFTELMAEMGFNITECPIKPGEHKIKDKEFNIPKNCMDTLKSYDKWKVQATWHAESSKDDDLCVVLYLNRVEKNKKEKKQRKKNKS